MSSRGPKFVQVMERGASRRTRALEKIRCQSAITEPEDRPARQQCNHFTIRGCTALLQKKNPELGPFSQMLCDQQCDEEQSKNLCPVSWKQFRRWNCSNCLKEVQNEGHSRCVSPSSRNKGVNEANIYPGMKDLKFSPSNLDVDSYRNVPDVPKQILGKSNIHSGGDQLYNNVNKVQHEPTLNTDDISYVKAYQRRSGKKRLLSEIYDSDQQDNGRDREHSEMRTSVPHIRRDSQPQLCVSGDQVGAAALVSAKFLRVFAGSFSSKLYLPRGSTGASRPMPAGKLIVIADSGVEYSVEVRITRRNRAVLQDGWDQVAHGERITMGQLAMFEWGADNTLRMKLFGPDGVCQALGPIGSSFIKELLGEPRGIMHLPPRYCVDDKDVIGKRVYALSECGMQYCLLVELVDGSLAFTDGWEALMDREGIEDTDSVAFVRSASMTMRFVVFNHRGVKKEERGRCSAHPMTVGLDVGPTPSCKWFFGPGVEEGGETINVMHAIQMSSGKDTLLYAASLQSNQMGKTGMHFSEEFSKQLPDETTPLKLRFNSSAVILRGFLTKDGSKISRITKGWAAFAKEHLLAAGTVYVFKFRTARKGWALTVVQVLV